MFLNPAAPEYFLTRILLILVVLTSVTIADDGMQYPLAAAVGTDGIVYVADRDLPGIWKFADNRWTIYFQGSKKLRTPLNAVRCLGIDQNGKLLAGDSATREVYRFNEAGQPQPLTKGRIGIPMALAVANEGTIFASDLETQRIVKIPADGGVPSKVADGITAHGLAIDGKGQLVAACHGNDAIVRLSADGNERIALIKGRPFKFPHHLAIGSNGEFYVADGYDKTIWKIENDAAPIAAVTGEPLKNPVGLAWSGSGLIVVDPQARMVWKLESAGKLVRLGD